MKIRKSLVISGLWFILVLMLVSFAWVTLRKIPITAWQVLEIVGMALLFLPLCIIAAIVIAKLTPKWTRIWFSLDWTSLCLFFANRLSNLFLGHYPHRGNNDSSSNEERSSEKGLAEERKEKVGLGE